MKENDFKSWVRRNWNGWLSSYEPRKGGSVGVADLQVVIKNRVVPVELKVGTIDGYDLCCHDIRPAQIQWHNSLWEAGGFSYFLIGISAVAYQKRPDLIVAFEGNRAAEFLQPKELSKLKRIDPKKFENEFRQYACYWLNP